MPPAANDQDWATRSQAWKSHADWIGEGTRPVTEWLVRELAPKPDDHVVELAAGTGEPGLAAAELVGLGGRVTVTDSSEDMLEAVRAAVAERGLSNVAVLRTAMEDVELADASADGVICRLGYMLSTDVPRAFAQTHRVLVPGGRLALAVWSVKERNPLFAVPAGVLKRLGHGPAQKPAPDAPGPLRLSDRAELERLLAAAGFEAIRLDVVPVAFPFPSVGDAVEALASLRPALKALFADLPPDRVRELREALIAGFEPHAAAQDGGGIAIPGEMLVATASRPKAKADADAELEHGRA